MKIVSVLLVAFLLIIGVYFLYTEFSVIEKAERILQADDRASEAQRRSHMATIGTALYLALVERSEEFDTVADAVVFCTETESVDDLGEGNLWEIDLHACGLEPTEMNDPAGGNYRVEVPDVEEREVLIYSSEEATESEYYNNPRVF